jgi:polar amino acid transport system substrate-binding protein
MRCMSIPRSGVAAAAVTLVLLASCAPVDEEGDEAADPTDTPSATEPSEPDEPTEPTGSTGVPANCGPDSPDLFQPGQLTVATDSPAYEPYFVDDDPTNGRGFESAVAYAVAEELGFSDDQVEWVTVPFNASYQPGAKQFDFDINQISITPRRAEAVTFSKGYYAASQAVITLKDNEFADATTLADLQDARLGVQVGTTSLDAVEAEIRPGNAPQVLDDTNAAKQALLNGQVDGIVADLPTAFYITAVEIPEATIAGQFQVTSGKTEEFGLLFEKDNPYVDCVDAALGVLETDGTLQRIEQRWMSDVVDVPALS